MEGGRETRRDRWRHGWKDKGVDAGWTNNGVRLNGRRDERMDGKTGEGWRDVMIYALLHLLPAGRACEAMSIDTYTHAHKMFVFNSLR